MERATHACAPGLPPSPLAVAERCYAAAFRALSEGDLGASARLFLLLALLEPRRERSWVGLGLAHEKRGQQPIAATVYTIGQRLCGGRSAWLHFGRARMLRALGHPREAELAFDSALALAHGTSLAPSIEEERCLS
jgi:predicted RNA polymerase sigma factor